MSAEADVEDAPSKKGSKGPLLVGLVLAVVGGAGGFYTAQSGLLNGDDKKEEVTEYEPSKSNSEVAFVALDPLIISLASANGRDHLRFSAQLDVVPAYVAEVEAIKPRIVDVLNGYLRAVDIAELEDPAALMRMRSHMLRRVQVVAGQDRIRDLLIMEFVLS